MIFIEFSLKVLFVGDDWLGKIEHISAAGQRCLLCFAPDRATKSSKNKFSELARLADKRLAGHVGVLGTTPFNRIGHVDKQIPLEVTLVIHEFQ